MSLSGPWTGSFDQPGFRKYPITINFTPDSITVDYPTLACGGTLTVDESKESVVILTEHIEVGVEQCVDGGRVTLWIEDDMLVFSWSHLTRTGIPTGEGKLSRASGP
jgi:hypothetical protein